MLVPAPPTPCPKPLRSCFNWPGVQPGHRVVFFFLSFPGDSHVLRPSMAWSLCSEWDAGRPGVPGAAGPGRGESHMKLPGPLLHPPLPEGTFPHHSPQSDSHCAEDLRSLPFSEGPEKAGDHRSQSKIRAAHTVEDLQMPGPGFSLSICCPAPARQAFRIEIEGELDSESHSSPWFPPLDLPHTGHVTYRAASLAVNGETKPPHPSQV